MTRLPDLRGEIRAARCRSCGASIFWCKTAAGKSMPVDAEPAPEGNIAVGADGSATVLGPLERLAEPGRLLYVSHFATCPQAASHRKAR